MKKRVASFLLAFLMLIPTITAMIPLHVHADGDFHCPNCDGWLGDGRDFCAGCWFCDECEDICSDCGYCKACAMFDYELHCPECGESCISEEFGDVPHCVACKKCEDCVDLVETSEGLMCSDCIEERGNTYIMCPQCGVNAIGSELEGLVDESDLEAIFEAIHPGDCGEHCEDCYEQFLCPECSECTLCKGVELCESCGICEECAVSYGYHCPECEECYAEAGQCPDGGEHCVNCCEFICEDCGTCAEGAGIDYCEECSKCENCYEHCPECGECYEAVSRCEDEGDHCRECCLSEGWICDGCGRCTEALGLEFCEYCGLCEECCKENRAYYGTKNCILDKITKPEEINSSKHDEKHHILRYTSSSDECHDVWCAFPGCDYYVSDSTPHEFIWKTVEKASLTKEGKRVGICVYCGDEREETVPKINPPEYYFVEQPKDISVLPTKNNFNFYIRIGEVGSEVPPSWGFNLRVSALPVTDGDKLPGTVEELRKNVYHEDIRNTSYQLVGMNYAKGSGEFPCTIYAKSGRSEGKFANYTAQGKALVWRLAVYDIRGGKITYSNPFTIDWNAKHYSHTAVWVSGQISEAEQKLYFSNSTAQTLKFYDGTYHWGECSVCGDRLTVPERHRYSLKGREGNCKGGVEHYECKDCGHTFDLGVGYAVTGHTFTAEYKHNGQNHWQVCTVCGAAGPAKKHDLKQKVYKDCTKTITVTICETCGYAHMEHTSGTGHKYTSNGEFNGWYGDKTHHWKVCTVCGYVNKAKHTYVGGACSVCGIDFPQFAIVGAACTHGTELRIELMNDIDSKDKALFLAGKWNATWYDDATGNTVGLGKTYPLDKGDEGHSFRADVSMIGGDTYYAYMEGVTIKTEYLNVKGYPATCATEGLKDHQVCIGCGQKFIGGKVATNVTIPKLTTHTYDYACDAVCNVCGFVRDVTHHWSDKYVYAMDGHSRECTACGISSGLEAHHFTLTWQTEADCEHDGVCEQKCECGYSETEYVKASGHSWIHADTVPALCINEGFGEHYYCENCYAMATDAEGKNQVGIKKLLTPIDPENHVGGDKLGYNETEHYTICDCGAHIENAAHTFDENGRCTVCHYKKGSSVKTAISGLTKHELVLSNCITNGTKAYYTDKDGKMYLSRAGIKEVTADDLILPVSTVRHVGGDHAYSGSEHWIACACGAEIRKCEHKFGEDHVCTVCGYHLTQWWIWLIIGGVAVLVAAVIVILIFVKKKNKKNDPPTDPAAPRDEPALPQNGQNSGDEGGVSG